MTDSNIGRIVIVGGGTAGWMTAAALAKATAQTRISIVLVESDEIGTVGVGEATVPAIHQFNQMLGIDVQEFLRACQGTFKLGIEFVHWGDLGRRYMHPFSFHGAGFSPQLFHHLWLKFAQAEWAAGRECQIENFNFGAEAAIQGRFAIMSNRREMPAGPLTHAYHFDAGLYAAFLRRMAERGGVERVEGKVVSVSQDGETGFLQAVRLESGQILAGDFFIDCSGFRGVLIEETLRTGYDDWSHWLPCDRALAVASEHAGPPLPVTRSTAGEAGWFWRIPLQNRVGNGHVYASAVLEDDQAEQQLLSQLDGKPLGTPRRLRFRTGKRKQVWNRNCLAIGLSAGFLEPLESTSIHLIQTAIFRLLSLFPNKGFDSYEQHEFNCQTKEEYENIRDFLIAHYRLSNRQDVAFWQQCGRMAVPDRVTHNLQLFSAHGRLPLRPELLFSAHSWMSVLLGQGMRPRSADPLLAEMPDSELRHNLSRIRRAMLAEVEQLPKHSDFLRTFCTGAASDPRQPH